ncbi:hypothetical protein IKE96_03265 [bacterium]|nr:hypothetical protein [bacterium]
MINLLKLKILSSKMRKFLEKKEYRKTIEFANEILESDEKNLFALKCKSDALRQLGDFNGSLECANIIVDLEPTSFNLANQAVLLWFLDDVEGSFEILDYILMNFDDYNDAFNNKSIFLCELERFDEVIELCDYILEKNPNFLNALCMKSTAHYKMGDFSSSLEFINKALEIDNKTVWRINFTNELLEQMAN